MDLKELTPPPPPLDLSLAQKWLQAFQKANPSQGQDLPGWVHELDQVCPPQIRGVSGQDMLAWIQENNLIEPQGSGWALSLRGIAAMLARNGERKSPDQAWEHVAELLACCQWVNSAPAQNAPMEISDVLLFGSITNPDKETIGDLDCILLFKSKQDGAYSLAEKVLGDLGMDEVLRPRGSRLPSFRAAVRQWLEQLVPFASLDDQMRTIEVLLDQDKDFACYSLLGKEWDHGKLANTSADEEAALVLQALERGRSSPHKDYVQSRIEWAMKNTPDPRSLVRILDKTSVELEKRIQWWEQLDKPGLGMRRSVINLDPPNEHPLKSLSPLK